jgi:hypothetical protein
VPTFTDFIPTLPTVNRKFLITDFRLLLTSVKPENFIDFYRSQKKVKDPRCLLFWRKLIFTFCKLGRFIKYTIYVSLLWKDLAYKAVLWIPALFFSTAPKLFFFFFALLASVQIIENADWLPYFVNGTLHIRHLCTKMTILSFHRHLNFQ